MEIVPIFAESLYAVQYENEAENEYDRLMDLWTDASYLYQFAKDSNIPNLKSFVDEISEDAEDIQDFMDDVEEGEKGIDNFFTALDNMESGFRELSLRKGKPNKKSFLRLYAIRIDSGTYLITGGAIKLVYRMQESEDLMQEKWKLGRVRDYLKDNGVFDSDSFQEFKTELDES